MVVIGVLGGLDSLLSLEPERGRPRRGALAGLLTAGGSLLAMAVIVYGSAAVQRLLSGRGVSETVTALVLRVLAYVITMVLSVGWLILPVGAAVGWGYEWLLAADRSPV
ncbi:hypothetical protein BRC83_02720 [Halobacteriales archaeon QS_1_68_17]|nr:MAG: hypothetical protein BRC83_02720 [Halobacteriales archaeon QS_1_68_17]